MEPLTEYEILSIPSLTVNLKSFFKLASNLVSAGLYISAQFFSSSTSRTMASSEGATWNSKLTVLDSLSRVPSIHLSPSRALTDTTGFSTYPGSSAILNLYSSSVQPVPATSRNMAVKVKDKCFFIIICWFWIWCSIVRRNEPAWFARRLAKIFKCAVSG